MERLILYYSSKCPISKQIVKAIYEHKLNHFINDFISVDTKDRQIPVYITQVPTLVVLSKTKKTVEVGNNIYKWIKYMIEKIEMVNRQRNQAAVVASTTVVPQQPNYGGVTVPMRDDMSKLLTKGSKHVELAHPSAKSDNQGPLPYTPRPGEKMNREQEFSEEYRKLGDTSGVVDNDYDDFSIKMPGISNNNVNDLSSKDNLDALDSFFPGDIPDVVQHGETTNIKGAKTNELDTNFERMISMRKNSDVTPARQ